MPALTNISVGSLCGTSGAEATRTCPFFSKNSRKKRRTSLVELIGSRCKCHAALRQGERLPALVVLLASPRGCLGTFGEKHLACRRRGIGGFAAHGAGYAAHEPCGHGGAKVADDSRWLWSRRFSGHDGQPQGPGILR